MPHTRDVVAGSWYDSATGHHWWTLRTYAANVWVQFLGILVTTFMAPRLVKLLLYFMEKVSRHNEQNGRVWYGFPQTVDTERTLEGTAWEHLADAWHAVFPAIQLPSAPPSSTKTERIREAVWHSFIAILLLIPYFSIMIGGILLALLAGSSIVLSNSEKCGVYIPGNLSMVQQIATPYQFLAESESATYAHNCFGKDSSTDGCNSFVSQDIKYTVQHNASCPFEDSMCYLGPSSAFTLTTKAISARQLGINTGRKFEFRRKATFTALNMNDTFISYSEDGNQSVFSYNYGHTPAPYRGKFTPETTWQTYTYGDSVGKTPSCSASAFVFSNFTGASPYFQPIPQLAVPHGSILTLLLILPGKIYYEQPSEDPIFPTNSTPAIPPSNDFPFYKTAFYVYQEGYARPLAAVDTIEWRAADISPEWHSIAENPYASHNGRPLGALWLLWNAIFNSFSYQSISRRLGSGLVASSRISQFMSLPLDREQWKTESTALFETSLARTFIEARNIARGVYADYPGYVRQNYPAALCHRTYLLPAAGWTNVHLGAFLGLLLPSLFICLLAYPYRSDPEALVIDMIVPDWFAYKIAHGGWIFLRSIGSACAGLARLIYDGIMQLFR